MKKFLLTVAGAVAIVAGMSVAGASAVAIPSLPPSSPPYVININDHVVGFYLGRGLTGPSGLESLYPNNWVNGGAWDLGAINYAVYQGDEAVMYDASTLPWVGQWERDYLTEQFGIEHFTVVLSHWHLDHIGGLAAFADSPIYALSRTNAYLLENKDAIEAGTLWGPPAIPVVLPTNVVNNSLNLKVGKIKLEFRHFNIHSRDGFVMVIPRDKALYAGDTLEDTVTYMGEPGDVATHIKELARMRMLPIDRIYPNHGDPNVIMAGGYTKTFVDAVKEYDLNMLLRVHDPGYLTMSIEEAIPDALAGGAVSIWEPYRVVHQNNLQLMHDYWLNLPLPSPIPRA